MKETEELNAKRVKAEELNEEAKLAYKEKDFEKAAECLLRAANLCPIEGKYFINLGLVFTELKKYKEAVSFFSKAIEFGFEIENSYIGRGNAWTGLKDDEKAIDDFTEALKINEDSFKAREDRAVAYNNSQQFDKALEDYNILIEKNPHDSTLLALRWVAYTNLGKSEEAKRDFDEWDKESTQMNNPN